MFTLKELRDCADYFIKNQPDCENFEVMIDLEEPSIGASASCTIKSMNKGFDWEHGQVRLTPAQALVRKMTKQKLTKKNREVMSGRTYCHCAHCACTVGKDDKFCKDCGRQFE